MNDAFIALIIEFAFFAAFYALAIRLECLIHDHAQVALVAYTCGEFSGQQILSVTLLSLQRIQPKDV